MLNKADIKNDLNFLLEVMKKADVKYLNNKPVQRLDSELLKIAKAQEDKDLFNYRFIGNF